MKKVLSIVALSILPSVALSGAHGGLSGHGTGIVTDNEVMEGKTGALIKRTTEDIWIWDNPLAGFPAASSATCNQFIAVGGAPQPIGIVFVCRSVDPDGDITLNNGLPQADGSIKLTIVAATGKWAPYIGASWIGATDIDLGDDGSVYTFTPAN